MKNAPLVARVGTALLASCSSGSSGDSVVVLPESSIQTLGLTTSSGILFAEGDHALFLVSEFSQGQTDLNGDGDTFDELLHVVRVDTGVARNLGFRGISWILTERFLVVQVNERIDGDADGSGTEETLLYVEDLASGATFFVDLETDFLQGSPLVTDGRWVVVPRSDGTVLAIDLETAEVVDLGRGAGSFAANVAWLSDRRVYYATPEGETDLNGDGEDGDVVVAVFDLVGRTEEILPYSLVGASLNLEGEVVTFRARESNTDAAVPGAADDLNGDGDTDDVVRVFYDVALGRESVLPGQALGSLFPVFGGGFAAQTVIEDDVDLNGDGDLGDSAIQLVDLATGVVHNLGYSVHPELAMSDSHLVFGVDEAAQGPMDLDGDGDENGFVVHVVDLATGAVRSLGLEMNSFCFCAFDLEGAELLLLAGESATGTSGAGDAGGSGGGGVPGGSGGGDPAASPGRLVLFDLARGTERDLGFQPTTLLVDFAGGDGLGAFVVPSGEGLDTVFETHVYDFATRRITNTGLQAFDVRPTPAGLIGSIDEFNVGDLNGDGDDIDRVIFRSDL